jgi:hypothetical protein
LTVRAGEQSVRSSFDNFPDGRYQHPSDAAIIAALRDIAEQPGVPSFGRILHVEQRNMSHVTVALKKTRARPAVSRSTSIALGKTVSS